MNKKSKSNENKILNTNEWSHRIVLYMDENAPKDYMKRWKEFRNIFFESNYKYLEDVGQLLLERFNLESNKKLPYLSCHEGGFGGDYCTQKKQIRFPNLRHEEDLYKVPQYGWNNEHYLIIRQIRNGKDESWTYEELDDILNAFVEVAREYVQESCVDGYISIHKR